MKSLPNKWIYIGTFMCAAAGLLLPFWPLIMLGVAAAVLSGRTIFGVILALLFDIALGSPTGWFHWIHFPLVVLALACFVVRYVALRYMLERGGGTGL